MRLRIVLDTNSIVAAYWNRRSASARIIEACIAGEFQACYTSDVEAEVWRIIQNIKASEEYVAVMKSFFGRAERVEPWAEVDIRAEDPDDQKFLICAASADANYLITSDDHLLKIKSIGRTRILKPGVFWQIVHGESQS